MKNLKNMRISFLMFLLPLLSFAQRADRFGGGNKEQGIPGPSPIDTPVNQYEIALIIMAVSIIVYFVYRQYTAKKQA